MSPSLQSTESFLIPTTVVLCNPPGTPPRARNRQTSYYSYPGWQSQPLICNIFGLFPNERSKIPRLWEECRTIELKQKTKTLMIVKLTSLLQAKTVKFTLFGMII